MFAPTNREVIINNISRLRTEIMLIESIHHAEASLATKIKLELKEQTNKWLERYYDEITKHHNEITK